MIMQVLKRSAAIPLAIVLMLAFAAPALAHHKDGHTKGKDKSGSEWTEDNDTNDGDTPNNVSDEGDNAHPSGKDRSVEHGKSGNQGKSKSDPDDDGNGPDRSNGGPDKPNGSGGVDLADQDGNNGCGNDDDFEDDNEGWCHSKPKKEKPADEVVDETPDDVLGDDVDSTDGDEGSDDVEVIENEAAPEAAVLGTRFTAASAEPGVGSAALPFTGGDVMPFLVASFMAIGVGMLLARRREH